MGIMALEGVVKQGRIWLKPNVRLPEKTRVYVLAPDIQIEREVRVFSPHLVHPEQAADFELEVIEEPIDASV